MITAILLLFIVGLTAYYYHVRYGRMGRMIDLVPGPDTLPFLGNILRFQGTTEELFTIMRNFNTEYYPIHRIWGGLMPVVNICHPDDAEALLSSVKHIEKAPIYHYLHPWLATGLLTSTGAKWQHRRKILTPAFHFNVLQQFVDIFVEEGERLADDLKAEEGPVIKDLLPLISERALNTICETAMGTTLQGRGSFQYKYRQAVHRMGNIVVYRLVRPWFRFDSIFSLTPKGSEQRQVLKILHGFTNKIIGERKQYHDQTNGQYLKAFRDDTGMTSYTQVDDTVPGMRKKRLAMLDLLIAAYRNNNEIDDNGIREEVDTFMFEGHDTTAMGMCFTLLLFAEHKEIQNRARAEIDAALEQSGGKMTMSVLQKFAYFERCIKESLRLYPSVPFISRLLSEDLHLKNYVIPAGVSAHVHIYDLHRDPNFWPNPTVFDPDRFLPENMQTRHPYAYIPFSAGPRNCIGQRFAMLELKAIIAHILHNFYLEPVDRLKDVRMVSDLVLRPAHPIRVKFIPRK